MNKSHEITPLMKLDHLLGALTGPDLAAKRLLLSDLGELLNRHAYTGSEPCYGFANPVIEAMPVRLEPALIRRIAQAVGPVLLDQGEVESLRVTAAFVLGKTFDPGALAPGRPRRQPPRSHDERGGPPVRLRLGHLVARVRPG